RGGHAEADGEQVSGEGGRDPAEGQSSIGALPDPRRAGGDLARDSSRRIGSRIGRTLGRSHTPVSREINRCGGRGRYRAHAAERTAWRRARRPRATKLELCGELRELVIERLGRD